MIRRQMSEADLKAKLKDVFKACDTEDYKTKVMRGHLYDAIPYHSGLKTRIELLGMDGTLEKLEKRSRKKGPADEEILKLAHAFSTTYGFERSVAVETLKLCAEALEVPLTDQGPPISQDERSLGQQIPSAMVEKVEQEKVIKSHPQIPWFKRRFNLIRYLIFLSAMTGGMIAIIWHFGTDVQILNAIESPPFDVENALIVIGGAVAVLTLLPIAFRSYNVSSLYPGLVLVAQVVVSALASDLPLEYESLQIGLWLVLIGSFILLATRAIFVPKGTDCLSCKVIVPYYAAGAVYFAAQFAARSAVHFI